MVLSAEHLSKRYRGLWALRDASFSVRAGEILGLIGPNGSGKTTLFATLAGAIPATAGTIRAGGIPLAPDVRKNSLFYVPEAVRPWPDQSVARVLDFIARMFGADRARRDAVVGDLGLERFLPARLRTLSKGEHRRVLLAIGLLTTQPLLLLDEPFDGLDLRQTRNVMRVLRAHAARGRTLFLSIHQLTDAARICDRFILLSGGRVVGQGALDELRRATNLTDGGLEDVFLALTERAPREVTA